MPLSVRRFCTSSLLVIAGLISIASAQSPTSGEVMRERISKAKAFIAVRNYNAAIYELENIRRETADPSVQGVVNVLLMNSYLEQSDYKRAQDLLNEFYAAQKTTKPNAQATYFAVSAQVVSGARNRIERYRALGLNVADRTLPLEAINDLEKMRETLELVVTQAKEIGKEKAKSSDAMALLEEAANSRGMMGRDDYDVRRWKDEVTDARERVINSRSVVINAVNDGTGSTVAAANPNNSTPVNYTAATPGNTTADPTAPVFRPVPVENNSSRQVYTPIDTSTPLVQKTVTQEPVNTPPQTSQAAANRTPNVPNTQPHPGTPTGNETPVSDPAASGDSSGALDVGSLIPYATTKAPPVYPSAAKSMRQTGVVTVEVTVDENGMVSEVQKATGPVLLQTAARDAIRKWRFKPFTRDGQPVRATGFINFNFAL